MAFIASTCAPAAAQKRSSETMYHSGLTGDPRFVCERLAARSLGPIFVVGFSLGANVALKLAGELGSSPLLAGVCAICAPINLAACVRVIDKPRNLIYARRFLSRLRERVRTQESFCRPIFTPRKGSTSASPFGQFDDRFTAPLFGFGTAANYYATQSARNFLNAIRIPTFVVTAQDDPLVPFEIYNHEAFQTESGHHVCSRQSMAATSAFSPAAVRASGSIDVCLDWIDATVLSSIVCARQLSPVSSSAPAPSCSFDKPRPAPAPHAIPAASCRTF